MVYRNRYAESDSEFLARITDALRGGVTIADDDDPESIGISEADLGRLDLVRRKLEDYERNEAER